MNDVPTTVATLCRTLAARIASGEFSAGGKLPSERALSEQFSTTRITLQEALGQLEAQGVIYRQVRRGWFISPPRLIYNPLQRSHFHAMAQQQGRDAHTEVIDSGRVQADAALARRLELPEGAEVYRIRRLRYIDGRAVLYCEHYLNPAYFAGILDEDLTQSLTGLYAERYDIRYGRVRFDMLPTLLPQQAAAMLKVTYGSPALFITRVNRDQHDRVIDCDLEYWRYDALHIDVEAQ
ncbi:UTRA domain-containing protein [Serratia entomophila]|jgi:DNA-binding GntR family transcriptional regulator|uniref:UTRA domain-containing protein n=1 Tax=Serratia entomophila TaxID=42906 RepID=UPI00217A3F7B|nr:UTRA domain-containing protein [Serratia entomophila]CAI1136737.1 HTH-type transcriptional regulator frlR [Serratia entomophila]CAI1165519.1 HTH-type transcriptional regulator frlR [Serratia entomophila]CAI1505094.1 HTH-type transcriptional regulator frlR [Serratia entomophila]CAI1875312.1 HTH-type transcriptional regulator frlR [Serratia entomophila]CAI1876369.1 HTH-type transcriptional regulator frlR [Serratia entomophila]